MIKLDRTVPIFLLEKEDDLNGFLKDVENTCYFITKQGFFTCVITENYKTIKKVDSIPYLFESKMEEDEIVNFNLPKIPRNIFFQSVSFFKEVFEKYKSEAALVLYWDKESRFKWVCPEQKVSSGGVDYELDPPTENWISILHIHSHASMSAFHSGKDDKDEQFIDGYNVTVGKLNCQHPEYESRIILNGVEHKLKMSDIVEDWEDIYPDYPKDWMNNVSEKEFIPGSMLSKSYVGRVGTTAWQSNRGFNDKNIKSKDLNQSSFININKYITEEDEEENIYQGIYPNDNFRL